MGLDALAVFTADSSRYFRTALILAERVDSLAIDEPAKRLRATIVDYHKVIDARIPDGARSVQIDRATVLDDLRSISTAPSAMGTIIVQNLDIALAKWERDEVERFWRDYERLEKQAPRALVVVIPSRADSILPPSSSIRAWEQAGRCTGWPEDALRNGSPYED